ncbi:glycosyltransferase [uncultured Roseovarius sp.]|uniref:glycosyltransferase n=1 Tax=uncultured Roseovarius sp. TaxID=293344 RepID=UPI00261D81CC|nr:glycosyltransferase [uncultured Roseovarius sp.]
MSADLSLTPPRSPTATGGPEPRGGRVVFWGTYDLSKPRTRILRDGLKELGVEVVEIHAEIWPQHADKSQMSMAVMAWALVRALLAYPLLILRYLRTPWHEAVFIPYLGVLDTLVLWPFARLRRQRITWDMFLSLYDTVVHDRQMVSRKSPTAWALWGTEWLASRAADRVLLDTKSHADHIARIFSLSPGKLGAVPVGAEPGSFRRLPPPELHDGPTRVLFYGQLIPLHGLQTILAAATSEKGRAIDWHLIGTGQERNLLEFALAGEAHPHITWQDWVPYEELTGAIALTDICLGIFGASGKAASVVPNKVYQALIAGRSVITRHSPAMTETFGDAAQGIKLIPHSDPEALLQAIADLRAEGYPVLPEGKLDMAQPHQIAQTLCQYLFHPSLQAG